MGHDLSQDAEIWDDAYKLDRAHVFHSWHAQRNLDPTEVVTGHRRLLVREPINRVRIKTISAVQQ